MSPELSYVTTGFFSPLTIDTLLRLFFSTLAIMLNNNNVIMHWCESFPPTELDKFTMQLLKCFFCYFSDHFFLLFSLVFILCSRLCFLVMLVLLECPFTSEQSTRAMQSLSKSLGLFFFRNRQRNSLVLVEPQKTRKRQINLEMEE